MALNQWVIGVGAVHYSSGRQRMLMLTFCANVKVALTVPVMFMAASFTDKAIWPFLFEQVLVTRFWV
jgi:hypothetical protein